MKITFAICLLLLNNFDIISQQDTTKFSFVSERNEWNILIPDYFSPEIYTETYTFSAKDTLFSHGVENPAYFKLSRVNSYQGRWCTTEHQAIL